MSCIKCHCVEIPESDPMLCPECFISSFEKVNKLPCAFIASISELMDKYSEASIVANEFFINVEGIVFSTHVEPSKDEKFDFRIKREWRHRQ